MDSSDTVILEVFDIQSFATSELYASSETVKLKYFLSNFIGIEEVKLGK